MNKSSCECVFSNLIGVFLGGASGEESTCQCRRLGFDPWVQKIPWSRKWQPTLIFLPGKSHGQWSLAGYSPLGHREMDTLSICTYNLVGRRELPSSYKLGGVGAGGEGDDRGWDVWMASPTRWTWVWVNSGVGDAREAWRAAIHGVTKSRTPLNDWTELNCPSTKCL